MIAAVKKILTDIADQHHVSIVNNLLKISFSLLTVMQFAVTGIKVEQF